MDERLYSFRLFEQKEFYCELHRIITPTDTASISDQIINITSGLLNSFKSVNMIEVYNKNQKIELFIKSKIWHYDS